jgi:L-rhamnose isomerase
MKYLNKDSINLNYNNAAEIFNEFGVDTDNILKEMDKIHISMHCWQGDDVVGFESQNSLKSGGILATGNYPGRARNGNELRQDLDMALSLIPGTHKVNLHAIYAETSGKKVDRDALTIEHFSKWLNWAKLNGIGLDFNPTFFSHEKADSGYTLSSQNNSIRTFWIEHAKRSREIASEFGKQLGTPCINNIWIPDGSKDLPADRLSYRKTLKNSLDDIFKKNYDKSTLLDSVECKLFGIGSESFVVGSHEFYMGYSINNDVMLCLDMGHFHPTESIADKISSILTYKDSILLHISRGVRWDSDHVALLNDDTIAVAQEVKRCRLFDKVFFALDFFDASINRLSAWITGARALQKSILISLLEPTHLIQEAEKDGDYSKRLALMEEFKTLPFGAVWNKYCSIHNIEGHFWLDKVTEYEKNVLSKRD